jgi:hypothetical protein
MVVVRPTHSQLASGPLEGGIRGCLAENARGSSRRNVPVRLVGDRALGDRVSLAELELWLYLTFLFDVLSEHPSERRTDVWAVPVDGQEPPGPMAAGFETSLCVAVAFHVRRPPF